MEVKSKHSSIRWVVGGFFGLVVLVGIYLAAHSYVPKTISPVGVSDDTAVPCEGNPASRISLGRPFLDRDSSPAEFKTVGDEIFVIASDFTHGGILDLGRGLTEVYIGLSTKLPTYDEQHSTVSNTIAQFRIKEDG